MTYKLTYSLNFIVSAMVVQWSFRFVTYFMLFIQKFSKCKQVWLQTRAHKVRLVSALNSVVTVLFLGQIHKLNLQRHKLPW